MAPNGDDDITGTLARSALFKGVPRSIISDVSARCDAIILASDERLLTVGARDERLYLVISGILRVLTPGAFDEAQDLGPGQCVGGRSLVAGGLVSADVVARESTVLIAFDQRRLWALVDASPEFARNLLGILAGRKGESLGGPGEGRGGKGLIEHTSEDASTVDAITGLPNRRWMENAFTRQIERSTRTAQATSILVLDVDHFGRLSAEQGPRVADAVLCRAAEVLVKALRPDDLLSCCGHGRFAVLLPGFDAQATIVLAERLRTAIETAGAAEASALPSITVSIGGTTRRPFESLAELLRRAEDALEHAQQAGSD